MKRLVRPKIHSRSPIRSCVIALALLGCAACGVRGNPEPPLTPAELGRGKPTFTRSSDEFVFPTPTPAARATPSSATGSTNGKPAGGE